MGHRIRRVAAAVLATCALAAPLVPAGHALARTPATAVLDLGAGRVLHVSAGTRDVVSRSTVGAPAQLGCAQAQRTYRIGTAASPAASLVVTLRALPSGSKLVFAELNAPNGTVPISLQISTASTGAALHDLGLKPNLTYNETTGVDRTSGPIGWVDFASNAKIVGSALVSKNYEYTNLTKVYSKSKTSTVRRFIGETRSIGLGSDAAGRVILSMGLVAHKSVCQRYVLLTDRAITDTATAEYSVGRVTSAEWAWMDPLGSYGKAPYSIEPATSLGYVRDLVHSRAAATLPAYRTTASGLFEDLLVNDLYTLSLTRSGDGLWRTNYTSTWVKDESGITAPFVDTRNNEQLAEQFLAMTDTLCARGVSSVAPARGWSVPFASYLLGRAQVGAVSRTPHGAFFADYYDSGGTVRVHTSLNHALGEMNYLMKLHIETSNPVYLALATVIKSAVDDTGSGWVRPNSDLWYQRNTNGTYVGTDYVSVTYWDLINSQGLLRALTGSTDPVMQRLITAKAHFLGVTPPTVFAPMTAPSMHQAAPATANGRTELP